MSFQERDICSSKWNMTCNRRIPSKSTTHSDISYIPSPEPLHLAAQLPSLPLNCGSAIVAALKYLPHTSHLEAPTTETTQHHVTPCRCPSKLEYRNGRLHLLQDHPGRDPVDEDLREREDARISRHWPAVAGSLARHPQVPRCEAARRPRRPAPRGPYRREEDCHCTGAGGLQHLAEQRKDCAPGCRPCALPRNSQAERDGGTGHRMADQGGRQERLDQVAGGDQVEDVRA